VLRHHARQQLAIAAILLIASAPVALAEEPGARVMQRWGCLGCHSLAGAGGKVAPPLDHVIQERGEDYVRQKIHNPRGTNPHTIMPTLPLTASEIDEVIAYLTHQEVGAAKP